MRAGRVHFARARASPTREHAQLLQGVVGGGAQLVNVLQQEAHHVCRGGEGGGGGNVDIALTRSFSAPRESKRLHVGSTVDAEAVAGPASIIAPPG
jgi:hypothetical protein